MDEKAMIDADDDDPVVQTILGKPVVFTDTIGDPDGKWTLTPIECVTVQAGKQEDGNPAT